nr:hypothetical protein [Abalone asfa-like virus]
MELQASRPFAPKYTLRHWKEITPCPGYVGNPASFSFVLPPVNLDLDINTQFGWLLNSAYLEVQLQIEGTIHDIVLRDNPGSLLVYKYRMQVGDFHLMFTYDLDYGLPDIKQLLDRVLYREQNSEMYQIGEDTNLLSQTDEGGYKVSPNTPFTVYRKIDDLAFAGKKNPPIIYDRLTTTVTVIFMPEIQLKKALIQPLEDMNMVRIKILNAKLRIPAVRLEPITIPKSLYYLINRWDIVDLSDFRSKTDYHTIDFKLCLLNIGFLMFHEKNLNPAKHPLLKTWGALKSLVIKINDQILWNFTNLHTKEGRTNVYIQLLELLKEYGCTGKMPDYHTFIQDDGMPVFPINLLSGMNLTQFIKLSVTITLKKDQYWEYGLRMVYTANSVYCVRA